MNFVETSCSAWEVHLHSDVTSFIYNIDLFNSTILNQFYSLYKVVLIKTIYSAA